jgi:hypothetical protein
MSIYDSAVQGRRDFREAFRLERSRTIALRGMLEIMVEEKCDYMRINSLGDPEEQHNVKLARAVLAETV